MDNALSGAFSAALPLTAPPAHLSPAAALEADLIEHARVDPAAFEAMMRQFEPRIFRFVYTLVGDAELARDLTQDTFLSAYKNLTQRADTLAAARARLVAGGDTGDPEPDWKLNVSAWLYTIARNAALSELRRRKVVKFFSFWQKQSEGDEREIDHMADTPTPEPGGSLEDRAALRDQLERAMVVVGRERLVSLLLFIDGFSYKEICSITGDSLSSVKSQIFRAKESLRRALATNEANGHEADATVMTMRARRTTTATLDEPEAE